MRIRALDSYWYGGRDRRSGDIFDTETDMHAQLLIQNGKAELVIVDDDKPKRGRYRRADMRADE